VEVALVWLLQRNDEILTCEIREGDRPRQYEFEVASKRGPAETVRFDSPTDSDQLVPPLADGAARTRLAPADHPRIIGIEEELG
jgi:hypothetical protein